MEEVYLVVVEKYQDEENSVVCVCSSLKKAESLINQFKNNNLSNDLSWRVDTVKLNQDNEVLWDCYRDQSFSYENYI